jgi:hypothetical protein
MRIALLATSLLLPVAAGAASLGRFAPLPLVAIKDQRR